MTQDENSEKVRPYLMPWSFVCDTNHFEASSLFLPCSQANFDFLCIELTCGNPKKKKVRLEDRHTSFPENQLI